MKVQQLALALFLGLLAAMTAVALTAGKAAENSLKASITDNAVSSSIFFFLSCASVILPASVDKIAVELPCDFFGRSGRAWAARVET